MAETRKPAYRPQDTHGLGFTPLIPGGFYVGIMPGGFGCSLTGIHIPGPRAVIEDSHKRKIAALIDLPEPVQIPHTKVVVDISDSAKGRHEIEKPFNENDEQPLHDALLLALGTGIIRHVSDEEMKDRYPGTWAARQTKIVWTAENAQNSKTLSELHNEASEANKFYRLNEHAKENEKVVRDAIDTPRGGKGGKGGKAAPPVGEAAPPPPPPS